VPLASAVTLALSSGGEQVADSLPVKKRNASHNSLVFKDRERALGFAHHSTARNSYDEHRARGTIRAAEAMESGIERIRGGSQIQNQDLILLVE